jgi:hypothetical protein
MGVQLSPKFSTGKHDACVGGNGVSCSIISSKHKIVICIMGILRQRQFKAEDLGIIDNTHVCAAWVCTSEAALYSIVRDTLRTYFTRLDDDDV